MGKGVVKEGFDCNIGYLMLSEYSEAFLNFFRRYNCQGCINQPTPTLTHFRHIFVLLNPHNFDGKCKFCAN